MAPFWLAPHPSFGLFSMVLHLNSTRICIILDAMIFALAWNTYGTERLFASVILALCFLCAAFLDFLYLSRLQATPTFVPRTNPDAAMYFWMLARIVTSAGVVLVLSVPEKLMLTQRLARCALALALLMVIGVASLVFGNWLFLPDLQDATQHWQMTIHALTLALALLGTLGAILVLKRRRRRHETVGAPESVEMLLACIALALSELPDLAPPGLHGPAFRMIANVFFFRAVLGGSIKAPYVTMAQLTQRLQAASSALRCSELRLSGIIENALDAIITIDDAHQIVLANPAAATMFGTTPEAMRGNAMENYLPPRHRKGFQAYVKKFNKVRLSFFKTGSSEAGYDVSGLRTDGEEFPMEASISVMVEGESRFTILILRDISERKKAQEELSRSHAELRRLSTALQSGREMERKHLARDLHDDLGQLLAALRIDLSLLQQQAQQASKVQPTQLDNMDELLSTSIKSLRRIASDLRPRALDEGGLYFALQSLCKEFDSRHGVQCELVAEEEDLILDDQRTTTLYRIVQEALRNIVRHANASEVIIEFHRRAGNLEMRIHDDGRGIRADDFLNPAAFGLVDMRERVKAIHGELCITGEPQRGTRIDIRIPLEKTQPEHSG